MPSSLVLRTSLELRPGGPERFSQNAGTFFRLEKSGVQIVAGTAKIPFPLADKRIEFPLGGLKEKVIAERRTTGLVDLRIPT